MHEKEIFGSCAYGPHRPGAAAGGERRRRQNLTWELNGTTLTISGSGDMYDYYSYEDPWGSTVETVVFSADMTSIGNYAFQGTGLTEVTIPEGVTKIGKTAFYNCVSLQAVSLPSTLKTIGSGAFYGCDLTEISIPASVTSIGDSAFYIIRIWRPSRSWTARTTQPSEITLFTCASTWQRSRSGTAWRPSVSRRSILMDA